MAEFMCLVASCDVFIAFTAFAFVYISDILLGLINNVVIRGQRFAWKRFLSSFVKVAVGGLVLFALAIAQQLALQLELPVSDDVVSLASLAAFVMLFWQGFREGATGIYQKLRQMFDIEKSESGRSGGAVSSLGADEADNERGAQSPVPDKKGGAASARGDFEDGSGSGSDALERSERASAEPGPAQGSERNTGPGYTPDGPEGSEEPGHDRIILNTASDGGVEFLDDGDLLDAPTNFEIEDGEPV